ncbi:nitrate reductase molybdenum cofactor assembly chaperone [Marinobacter nanhaiticus D15-8W]|uniref:Nitrate reductase molybdenum cofactor assembly chaperone n=1 Tax=Marinobacter nanhaiticus D15-8W TaxID=626887 RepID=N6WXP6_9GAMM|nr:nitrate reductase molybdenum cofactor assembly chaperone [Marinobacter nanhaiticus]ENO16371.1 nitrate reductase molybdenum cofactor assembly chaperone [Marinobacter nanhaiticus D15-8W]BES72768.1 nitrate reductase molybdenum cofactor assembly chaperone [Marinobacter nanhaiticus D15-8W]
MQTLRVIARLLEYPTAELQAAKDDLVAAVLADDRLPSSQKHALLTCVERLCVGNLMDLQENYVSLFERGRSLSLLLFEHVHGESRDRGQAMVDLMNHYAEAGLELDVRELPDHLPLFLEYLSTREWQEIRTWLEDIHHILGLLAERLHQRESIYQLPFEALLTLAGQAPDRQELATVVAAEERDDTPEALDKVWEEEMVKFLDDQGESCGNSGFVGQRRHELDQVQRVHLSDELMQDAMKQQIGGA